MFLAHLESTPPRFGGDILIKNALLKRSAKPFPDSDRARVHFCDREVGACAHPQGGPPGEGGIPQGGPQGGPAGRQAKDLGNVFGALKKHAPSQVDPLFFPRSARGGFGFFN